MRFLLTLRCDHVVISDEIETNTYCPACQMWASVIAYSDYLDEDLMEYKPDEVTA